jgi:hypothetical protein
MKGHSLSFNIFMVACYADPQKYIDLALFQSAKTHTDRT